MKDIIKIISNDKNYVKNSKKFAQNVANIYQINGENLQKAQINYFFNNQIMGISDNKISDKVNYNNIFEDIIFEYKTQKFKGIYLDFNKESSVNLVLKLDKFANSNKIDIYVPKEYAKITEYSKIIVDMGISGGNIKDILEYAILEFGENRICAKISYNIRKFIIPNENKLEGKALNSVDLTDKNIFFSEFLCTNYYTNMILDEKCEFVIFDDKKSFYKKLEILDKLQIKNIFVDFNDLISYNIF